MGNCFFHYFKKLDNFNIQISFRHKREDSYGTWIGGFINFVIVGFALGFCIVYFIPFVKKKNYNLYYYTINLSQTEEFNLAKSKSAVAFSFECSGGYDPNLSIEDLLELRIRYNYYLNNGKNKMEENINIHNCTYSDFYNDISIINSISQENFNKLKCLNNIDKVIKNRYQDRYDNFTYFQIDVYAKKNHNISTINKYILDNDCKVELYYVDVKIEVDDFDKPIKPFINEVFLQLNPDFNSRMNTFFLNSYFESNNDLFFETRGDETINNLFSRTEQYFLHRDIDNPDESFAKLYIRADNKKMIIKRTYQTLTEFFAVTFSFWEDLFLICSFVITAYNKFSLNYSIEKKLFFFKEIKNNDFDITKNSSKIKELIGSIGSSSEMNITYQNSEINDILGNPKLPDIKVDKKIKNDLRKRKYTLDRHKLVPKKIFDFFNFFECKCCKWAKLDSQAILYSKAEDILDSKLDVIYYLKSVLTLDIYKNIFMDDKQEILKFLCMPIISSEAENKECYQYPAIYSDKDFNALENEISLLLKKPSNGETEKKLLNLVHQRLNEINN